MQVFAETKGLTVAEYMIKCLETEGVDYIIGIPGNEVNDLVIALEGITSKGGDSIRQSVALRTALLIGDTLVEKTEIEKQVKDFYNYRSQIVHGGTKPELSDKQHSKFFMSVEEFRHTVRRVICKSITIVNKHSLQLKSIKGIPETITHALDLYFFERSLVKRYKPNS